MNNKDRPIKAWGVCVIQHNRAPPPAQVEAFVQKFVQIYESHGGIFAAHPQHGKKPWMGPGNLADGGELGKLHSRPHTCSANILKSPRPGTRLATVTTPCLVS